MNPFRSKRKEEGFSLVEFVIASALGLLLITSLYELYISNKNNYHLQEGLSRLQENGRLAGHILNQGIRGAGYIGCSRYQDNFPLTNIPAQTGMQFKPQDIIKGYHASGRSWTPSLPKNLSRKVKPDTDAITVTQVVTPLASLVTDMTDTQHLLTTSNAKFKKNELLLISDCQHADVFKVSYASRSSRTTTQKITTAHPLHNYYKKYADVGELISTSYYIRKTTRKNNEGQRIYSLYRINSGSRAEELIEGVQDMHIEYGVSNNDTLLIYKKANQITDWQHVRSVRIALLLNTVDGVNANQRQYNFNGNEIKSSDHMIHREWDTYISLRSRS